MDSKIKTLMELLGLSKHKCADKKQKSAPKIKTKQKRKKLEL